MKILILVRHARAAAGKSYQRDYDRMLTSDGLEDIEAMSRWLVANVEAPDLMIVSAAKRTAMTAQVIMEAFAIDEASVDFTDTIYETDVASVCNRIELLASVETRTVMVVGHNPTMSQLLYHVTHHQVDVLPTCGVAIVEFDDTVTWNRMQEGRVRTIATPKLIADDR